MTGRKVGPVKVRVHDKDDGAIHFAEARLYIFKDEVGNQCIRASLNHEESDVTLILSKDVALELYLALREEARKSRNNDARKAAVRHDL